jgi:sugar lactone lactonase YvrE
MYPKIQYLAAGLLALLAAGPLRAVNTQTAEQVTYDHFEDGRFANISLAADGGLRLAPAMDLVAKLDAAVIWRAVADKHGNLYAGTGNAGKVYKITPDGKTELIFSPEEILTRALALDAQGNLYVGTSPDGRVYRIAPGGRPEIYFDPKDTYIWDLVFDAQGRLYVATGAKGRIYRLPPDYKPGQPAEVYFETDRTHVSCLAFDSQGRLLAGTGPKSLLFRIEDKDKAEVLANANSDEITGISAAPDGAVYFSTFNKSSSSSSGSGSDAKAGAHSAGAGATGGTTTTITVDDDGSMMSADDEPTDSPPTSSGSSSTHSKAGGNRSQLLRVWPNGYVEPVWSLGKVGVFSFRQLPDGRWLLGTDQQGRLFSVENPNDWDLLQQAQDSSEVSNLLPAPGDPNATLVFSSNPAQIFKLTAAKAGNGTYTCEAFDADQPSRWGAVEALASPPQPGHPLAGAKWETRTGNTPKPDDTWNAWQAVGADAQVTSAPARYLQYRVTLSDAAAGVRSVQIYYQNFNAPPVVERVGVVPVGVEVVTMPAPRPSIDLRQVIEGDGSAAQGQPTTRPQLRPTGDAGAFAVGWRATDPNDDTLLYTVQLRAVGEEKWVTLADELAEAVYSFSSRGFADGYYEVRVQATDKLDNPPGEARTAERISAPFLIDNTPPAITLETQSGDAASYTLTFRARDAAGVITSAQYTVDGQPPKPALPEGALFDKAELRFRLHLERLKPGPHSVVFEATDEAGNTGAAKATFESP